MTHPFSLRELLRKYRLTIAALVFLSVLESGLFVAQFYFIGEAINDLLKDSWNGIYILIVLFLVKVLVSYIKQKRISKTYKIIYDQLITDAVTQPLAAGEKITRLAPKSTFIYLLTGFFKGDLIKGFETLIRLFFVLIALFVMNKMIFYIAIALLILVSLLYYIQKKNIILLSKDISDELIKEYEILELKDTEEVVNHHLKLEKMDNALSGISANNLSIIEILSFTFLIAAMVVLVKKDGADALGTFFSMLYYVTAFSEILFLLPSIYQRYLRMQELSKKIK